ncbi:site-specific integrase [Bacillus sp. SD088]|uniref:site-specific integrase n=1 Tax=Bacillus sp. SD088 TaxID=2782012 RepID=UPI001A9746C6|nr:phage integrase N-terminal SAM-like domain-containing protein [Bacillus sp. SD088]
MEARKKEALFSYASDLNQFISWLEVSEKDFLSMDATHVTSYIEYLKKKKLSNTTIKRHLSVMNQLFAYYDILAVLPPDHVEKYPASDLKHSDFISTKEMHRLLESV